MSALGHKQTFRSARGNVRFTPNSDRESGHQQRVMSALPPKADMCGAARDVRFGPIADIDPVRSLDHLVGLENDHDGNFNAKCPRHFQVYYEVELGGLLNW